MSENGMQQMDGPNAEPSSPEFVGIKEFFGIVAKVVAAFAGAATVYFLVGYVIVLSFISRVKLYGLASFPRDFYSEATVRFISDFFETYGRHPYCSALMVISTSAVLFLFVRCSRCAADSWKGKALRAGVTAVFAGAVVASIALDRLPDVWQWFSDLRRLFLFMVAVPLLSGLFAYLAINFRQFALRPYRYYYVGTVLFVSLLVAIPVGYGDNVYDINLYPIVGFDCVEDLKLPALRQLKEDVDQQHGALFFLMGHTMERDIFFDFQNLSPPAKMILVERGLIKYVRLSRENINSVRSLLTVQKGFMPVPGRRADVEVGELPEEIKEKINRLKL